MTWEDIKCLNCKNAKKCCLGTSNFTCNCWKDIKMLSLNRSSITCIPLFCQEENTDEPTPAGKSGLWVIGESKDLIFFLPIYLVKSCHTLTLLYIIRLLLTSGFILFTSQVTKLQGECGKQAQESIQVSLLRYAW